MNFTRIKMEKDGYDARLLLSEDGTFWRCTDISYDMLKELAVLASATLCEINEDMHADTEAENDALNRAEEAGIRQRETDLELLYDTRYAGDI